MAAAVAPLLASLRELQRRHGCAVVVVHHARKGGARRAGQALRGSSEFHAWGDTNLYVQRAGDDRLQMSVEHRAWPGMSGISLVLRDEPGRVALVADEPTQAPQAEPEEAPPPRHRVLAALAETDRPMRTRELRAACRMRTATVGSVLQELLDAAEIVRCDAGWHLPAAARHQAPPTAPSARCFPADPQGAAGTGNGKRPLRCAGSPAPETA